VESKEFVCSTCKGLSHRLSHRVFPNKRGGGARVVVRKKDIVVLGGKSSFVSQLPGGHI